MGGLDLAEPFEAARRGPFSRLGERFMAIMGRHPVLCSWCEAEGRRTVVRYTSVPHSSGICPRHYAEEMARIESFHHGDTEAQRGQGGNPGPGASPCLCASVVKKEGE